MCVILTHTTAVKLSLRLMGNQETRVRGWWVMWWRGVSCRWRAHSYWSIARNKEKRLLQLWQNKTLLYNDLIVLSLLWFCISTFTKNLIIERRRNCVPWDLISERVSTVVRRQIMFGSYFNCRKSRMWLCCDVCMLFKKWKPQLVIG